MLAEAPCKVKLRVPVYLSLSGIPLPLAFRCPHPDTTQDLP